MCGIVGYIGDRDCADVLVNSLEKLEYRNMYKNDFFLTWEKTDEAMTQQESLFLKMV